MQAEYDDEDDDHEGAVKRQTSRTRMDSNV